MLSQVVSRLHPTQGFVPILDPQRVSRKLFQDCGSSNSTSNLSITWSALAGHEEDSAVIMDLSLPFGHSSLEGWMVPSQVSQASQACWHSAGQEGAASVTVGLNPMEGTGTVSAASLQKWGN